MNTPNRLFLLSVSLLIATVGMLITEIVSMRKVIADLSDANTIVLEARGKVELIEKDRAGIIASRAKLQRDRDRLTSVVFNTASNSNVLLKDSIDGTFSVLAFMDTNGVARQTAYIDGRSYLDFPYKVPLMKFSDLEWNWLTNHLRARLVTGTNAQQNSTVFTEHY